MDLLITVSNKDSAPLLAPLLRACKRRSCNCEVFITHEGVQTLQHENVISLFEDTGFKATACHDSWERYTNNKECPVTLGSQTNHSEMMARADRIISL